MNNLAPTKENVFSKIKRKLFKMFFSTEENNAVFQEDITSANVENTNKEDFKAELVVKSDEEEKRILEIKRKYDNNEIFEKDISRSDMKKIIKLYKQEKLELDREIESRRENIARMLRKLKQENATEN